jgi:hypothetical protein
MKPTKENVYKTAETKSNVANPFDFDFFKLPADIQKELDDKGLVGRFVSVKLLEEYNGQHPKGWRVYKRDKVENSAYTAIFGKDHDGYVRRRSLILAVKSKDEVDAHKMYLNKLADDVNLEKMKARREAELKDYLVDRLGKQLGQKLAIVNDYN